jgi:excisionase family DNA binding protein
VSRPTDASTSTPGRLAAETVALDQSRGATTDAVGRDARLLLTAAQLAERWQVPVRTIYAWARRGAIPHYRAGRLLRFDPAEVEDNFRGGSFTAEIIPDEEHPGESAFTLLTA